MSVSCTVSEILAANNGMTFKTGHLRSLKMVPFCRIGLLVYYCK